jgi:cephalosporin hydroxylase
VTLKAEYERLCQTPSDIYLHLPRMVELVEMFQAQHVVELGTRTGVSTIAWLYALESTGGRLTSVDIDAKPPIGDFDHWTFIQGDDCDPAIASALDPAEIVFIDTSHLYEHTLRELRLYRWLVKPGGVICLHDTMLPIPEGAPPRPLYPVRTAVEEFVAAEGFDWFNVPECWGFGVIRIPER